MIETFIMQDCLKNLSICDELINLYKKTENKLEGTAGDELNYKIKKSTEVMFSLNEFIQNKSNVQYIKELQNIIDKYIKKYEFSGKTSQWTITSNIKIQHYKKNEGFFAWHSERTSAQFPYVSRHLVFMTYLNDVEHDGETEFYYQKLKIKPEKGKTVIWPADWTHTHRGITSKKDEKYIITGWFNFIN